MEQPLNRMSRKRGRPPKYGVGDDEQQPATESVPAEPVPVPQPPVTGIRCPKCGRGIVPRRHRSLPSGYYGDCPQCGARMEVVLVGSTPASVRLVR